MEVSARFGWHFSPSFANVIVLICLRVAPVCLLQTLVGGAGSADRTVRARVWVGYPVGGAGLP